MKKLLFALALSFSLFSCEFDEYSAPIFEEKFTESNIMELCEKVKAEKDLTAETITYFSNGIQRLSFVKDSLLGKSVKDVIESEKEYVKEFARNQMMSTAGIALLKLQTENSFYGVTKAEDVEKRDYNRLYFLFKNNSNKAIDKISGEMLFFYRPEGAKEQTQLQPINFEYTEGISGSGVDTVIFNQPFDPNNQIAVMLRNEASRISGVLNIRNVEFKK